MRGGKNSGLNLAKFKDFSFGFFGIPCPRNNIFLREKKIFFKCQFPKCYAALLQQ